MKKFDVISVSDSFKDIHFVEKNKVVSHPRQKLLETVTENMKEADELWQFNIKEEWTRWHISWSDQFSRSQFLEYWGSSCALVSCRRKNWGSLVMFFIMKSVSMNFGTMWKVSCKILATLQRLRFLQVYRKLKILSVLLLLVLQRQKEGFQKWISYIQMKGVALLLRM